MHYFLSFFLALHNLSKCKMKMPKKGRMQVFWKCFFFHVVKQQDPQEEKKSSNTRNESTVDLLFDLFSTCVVFLGVNFPGRTIGQTIRFQGFDRAAVDSKQKHDGTVQHEPYRWTIDQRAKKGSHEAVMNQKTEIKNHVRYLQRLHEIYSCIGSTDKIRWVEPRDMSLR